MRVLHVVESMGAGVMTSLLAMVDATPELEHHLAVWPRRSHDDTGAGRAAFTDVHALPTGLPAGVGALRAVAEGLTPHVLHAHSSYAGTLARVARPRCAPIAYSPHCFGFERSDLARGPRGLVRSVERVLARRTDLLVAVSPHEAALARELGHPRVTFVPNRALPLDATATLASPPGPGEPLHVVALGRVSPQKDWAHFLAVRDHAVEMGVEARWTWLGGGDETGARALRDAGVEVTGWLSHREVVDRLSDAHAYLHTAAWESAPLSVLEAAGAGLPLVVRDIASLASLGTPGVAPGPVGLATRLGLLRDDAHWYDAQSASLRFAQAHSRDAQRTALLDAYALVGGLRGGALASSSGQAAE